MRKPRSVPAAGGAMLLSLAFILTTGCNNSEKAAEPPQESPSVSAPASSASVNPSPSTLAPSAGTGDQEKLVTAVNNVQHAGTEPIGGAETAKPEIKFDPYTMEKPLLMGIAIRQSIDEVTRLHGKSVSSYVMEDAEDPITVYEYKDFNVGFNSARLVEFVEIVNAQVDPGLNGLRIGQTTADVSQALGKPDSSTDYVMTYKTKTTILKLDVDAKTKAVQSIKLFGRTE